MVVLEKQMTESSADADAKATKSWYTKLLDNVVKEMIRLEAVSGSAVQANPVWMVPNEMLIAKVWGIDSESDFIWTMSVDKLISDYIAGSLAATPRDVARHFSMKWQMDADRLVSFEQNKTSGEKNVERMQAYANKLIQYAETLYDLADRDEVWEERQSFAG
jgi:hypothetical protein